MATTPRTLTRRELNRALLARQLLLERARTPLPRALERVAGIQAQYAPSMYVGLWSRVRGLSRSDLDRALERRSVVQGTLMRSTIHLVSARDYWFFALGIRRARREWRLRVEPDALSARELAALARRLRRRLGDGPLHRRELEALLGEGSGRLGSVSLWLDLVRVPPSGTWDRRRADLYAAAEDWLGPADADPRQGARHVVASYLRGFGPAPPRDIANWAGMPPAAIAPALRELELRRFRSEDGEDLLDLPRAPIPPADTPAPVRLLPTWDATLLVHARRTGVLPEEHRPRVFNTRTPQSVATFLVDGVVAGTWRYERGRVRLEPFRRLKAVTRRELEAEAERLAAFHA